MNFLLSPLFGGAVISTPTAAFSRTARSVWLRRPERPELFDYSPVEGIQMEKVTTVRSLGNLHGGWN